MSTATKIVPVSTDAPASDPIVSIPAAPDAPRPGAILHDAWASARKAQTARKGAVDFSAARAALIAELAALDTIAALDTGTRSVGTRTPIPVVACGLGWFNPSRAAKAQYAVSVKAEFATE